MTALEAILERAIDIKKTPAATGIEVSTLPNISKLSKLQKRLMLWIATAEGHFEYQKDPFGHYEDNESAIQKFGRIALGLKEPKIKIVMKRYGIKWQAADFLGRAPTNSDSSTINRSLAKLEERGLVERTQSRGRRRRTTHVKLTQLGIETLQELLDKGDETAAN